MKCKVFILALLSILIFQVSDAQVSVLIRKRPIKNSKIRHLIVASKVAKIGEDEKSVSVDVNEPLNALPAQTTAGKTMVQDTEGNVFEISTDSLRNVPRTPAITAVGGALTFPFKWRPQNGGIEPSLSLSGVGGIHIALRDSTFSLNLLLGVGISSITVNKNNSTYADTGNVSRSAGTFSFTALIELDNVQLGLTMGVDNNMDNTTDKWKFQSKPWFALGIGISIFSNN